MPRISKDFNALMHDAINLGIDVKEFQDLVKYGESVAIAAIKSAIKQVKQNPIDFSASFRNEHSDLLQRYFDMHQELMQVLPSNLQLNLEADTIDELVINKAITKKRGRIKGSKNTTPSIPFIFNYQSFAEKLKELKYSNKIYFDKADVHLEANLTSDGRVKVGSKYYDSINQWLKELAYAKIGRGGNPLRDTKIKLGDTSYSLEAAYKALIKLAT